MLSAARTKVSEWYPGLQQSDLFYVFARKQADYEDFHNSLLSFADLIYEDMLVCGSKLPSTRGRFHKVYRATTGLLSETPPSLVMMDQDAVSMWAEICSKEYVGIRKRDDAAKISDFAADRLTWVSSNSKAGAILPWLAHPRSASVQNHMLDAVQAYCQGDPDWHTVPASRLPPPSGMPGHRRSRVDTLLSKLKSMPFKMRRLPDDRIISNLIETVSHISLTPFRETRNSK